MRTGSRMSLEDTSREVSVLLVAMMYASNGPSSASRPLPLQLSSLA